MNQPQPSCGIRAALSILAAFGVFSLAASSAGADGVSVDELLSKSVSKAEVVFAIGLAPVQCQSLPHAGGGATTELCEWRLGDRDTAWRQYASALATRYRVGVICAFDLATGRRKASSCTAHARRSDRSEMKGVVTFRPGRGTGTPLPSSPAAKRAAAASKFEATLQLEGLIRLIGEVPQSCEWFQDSVTCVWMANARTPGHGTIVATIDGDMSKKARLLCVVPADGADRSPDSCRAAIGN